MIATGTVQPMATATIWSRKKQSKFFIMRMVMLNLLPHFRLFPISTVIHYTTLGCLISMVDGYGHQML